MSSKPDKNKNYEDGYDGIPEIKFKKSIDLKNFVIPFSQVHSVKREEFIYLGYEKIPFNTRHPLYQTVFRNEFADYKNEPKLKSDSTKFSVSF